MLVYEAAISENILSYAQFINNEMESLKGILKDIDMLEYEFEDGIKEYYNECLEIVKEKHKLVSFEVLNEYAPQYYGSDDHSMEFNFETKTFKVYDNSMKKGGCGCNVN